MGLIFCFQMSTHSFENRYTFESAASQHFQKYFCTK